MSAIFDPPDENAFNRPPAKLIGLGIAQFPALKLHQAWKEAAGPILLQQAEFEGLMESSTGLTLQIKIADPMWRNEFFYSRNEILTAYQNILKKMGFAPNQIPQKIYIHSGSKTPSPKTKSRFNSSKT